MGEASTHIEESKPKGRLCRTLTWIWAVFILVLLTMPTSGLRPTSQWWDALPLDKLVHAVLFGILYALAAKADWHGIYTHKWVRLGCIIMYAFFTECIQEILSYRFFELYDFIANITGATIVHLFFNRK